MRIFLLSISIVYLLTNANAQSGSLDKNFGDEGLVMTSFFKSWMLKEEGKQVLVQSDGRIVVVFSTYSGISLSRYLSEGSLDSSFGYDGYSQNIAPDFVFKKAAVLPDETILLGGTVNNNFGFIRFGKDGLLDRTFGKNGLVTVDFGSNEDLSSLIVHKNKVVAIGSTAVGSENKVAAVRLKFDGKPDKSFGKSGKLTLDLGTFQYSIKVLAIQDDKIIVGGSANEGDQTKGLLFRLLEKGNLDPTFGSKGISLIASGPISSLAVQKDYKIVALDNALLLRFTTNGFFDSSFGTEGKQQLHQTTNPASLGIQKDSKIIVCGTYVFGTRITRYNTDGSHDPSYGASFGGAYVEPRRSAYPRSMVIQSDGTALLTGYHSPLAVGVEYYLFKLSQDGLVDPNFDAKGLDQLTYHYFSGSSLFEKIAVQADGKILAAGRTGSAGIVGESFNGIAAARFLPNGTLDTLFGDAGKLMIAAHTGPASLSLRPTGGSLISTGTQLFGFTKDGTPDPLFGESGKITTEFQIAAMALLQNKILLLGDGRLWRLNANGSSDVGFGTNGVLTITLDSYLSSSLGSVMAIQKDGKIILIASAWDGIKTDYFIIRLNPDGSFDNSFDGDGKMIFNQRDPNFAISTLAIGEDGKIVVGGSTQLNGVESFAVTRINANGSIDNSFGILGMQYADFGVAASSNSIVIQNNGQIFLGGFTNSPGHHDLAIACFTKDGQLDKRYGDKGKIITDLQLSDDKAYDLVIAKERLLAAGETTAQNVKAGLIAAYKLAQSNTNVQPEAIHLDPGQSSDSLKVKVLNNPSSTYFTLQLHSENNEPLRIEILDISGKVVRGQQNISSNTTIQIGHDLIAGNYFVRVTQGKQKAVVKLIKQ